MSISRHVNDPRRDDMCMARQADTRTLFFVHNRVVRLIERYRRTIKVKTVHQASGTSVRADMSAAHELPDSISFLSFMRGKTQLDHSQPDVPAPSLGSKSKTSMSMHSTPIQRQTSMCAAECSMRRAISHGTPTNTIRRRRFDMLQLFLLPRRTRTGKFHTRHLPVRARRELHIIGTREYKT